MIIIQNWAHDNNSRDFGVITLCSDESTDVMRLNFAQLQSFPPRKKKRNIIVIVNSYISGTI